MTLPTVATLVYWDSERPLIFVSNTIRCGVVMSPRLTVRVFVVSSTLNVQPEVSWATELSLTVPSVLIEYV